MTTSNFYIGPLIKEGLSKDVKPHAIAEDAFATLINAYQFRGRITRRKGYTLLGRLANKTPVMGLRTRELFGLGLQDLIAFDTTESYLYDSVTQAFIPLPSVMPVVWSGTDYQFFFTTNYAGAFWATNFKPGIHGFAVTNFAGSAGVGNAATVQVTSPGNTLAVNDYVYFIHLVPALSGNAVILAKVTIAGNPFTVTAINLPPSSTFAWTNGATITGMAVSSTQTSSVFITGINNANPAEVTTSTPHGFITGNTVSIIDVVGYNPISPPTLPINGRTFTITMTGANTFTLNGVDGALYGLYTSGGIVGLVGSTAQDGIRFYAHVPAGLTWVNYNPPIDTETALVGALLIFPYRGYLVFLNTWEGNEVIADFQNFGNRARWTQIGTPYYAPPVPDTPSDQTFDINAARDDLFGRGGANDAPTQEVIIGAAFIRDVLIVYFERSTWRLRFVNNAQNPFVWERINVELGASSTFSTIPFDKGVMGISQRGIVISDGNDTIRFDEKIPDDIFNIRQSEHGLQRVYGIRTFRSRLNFWTFPNMDDSDGIYPNQVLVFNYETKNWSYFDDTFTCFGYFYPSQTQLGPRWIDLDKPWSEYNNVTSDVSVKATGLETVIAGNQQGFVFSLEQTDSQNDPSLYISNIVPSIISSPNHNLPDGTWITLSNINGVTSDDGVSLNNRNFKISRIDKDSFSLNEFEPTSVLPVIGATADFTINFVPILSGSVQINVGTLEFKDPRLDGILTDPAFPANSGTINYKTGRVILSFSPPLGVATSVIIRVVSVDLEQEIQPVNLVGVYVPEGLISKISNIDIQTKLFNFFNDDQRSRLSKIDFYTDLTKAGQFSVNVFADSSNIPVNVPLKDNLQTNVVLTTKNPFQIGSGPETLYRLFCDAIAQTVQLQITLSDRQMAVSRINKEGIEILSMIFTLRRGGRLV